MIIALFALAIAMIVGGLLAAFLGWDIVLVERGWTMVIAGSVFASSGALLLGIAAAVSRLAQMQAELSRLHASLNEEEAPAQRFAPDLSEAALAGGLLGGAAGAGAAALSEPEQPPLPLFPESEAAEREREDREAVPREVPAPEPVAPVEPRIYPEPGLETETASEEETAPEVKVPDFLLAGRYRETSYAETEEREIEEGLYVPEPAPEPAPEQAIELSATPAEAGPVVGAEEGGEAREQEAETQVEPAAEPATEIRPDLEEPAEEAEAEEPSAASTIIGTYNSGDNRYVMYSDGSIEAETPEGVFRFNSLDELKEFIASGGEGGPRSSAT